MVLSIFKELGFDEVKSKNKIVNNDLHYSVLRAKFKAKSVYKFILLFICSKMLFFLSQKCLSVFMITNYTIHYVTLNQLLVLLLNPHVTLVKCFLQLPFFTLNQRPIN